MSQSTPHIAVFAPHKQCQLFLNLLQEKMGNGKYELIKDINVVYVPATSFPEGIKAAFEKLETLIPPEENRTVFGLSWPDEIGKIMYKAAVEEKGRGEQKTYGLSSFVIKKGIYISELLKNYVA